MTVFHKTPPPWFEAVKDLKPGGKRRIGDGYLASFNGRAYMRYDFREKEAEVYEPQMTLQERIAINAAMREADESAAQSNAPPELMLHPRDWPVDGRMWLYKAGLNNDDIAALGAGWAPRMQRLVVPFTTLEGTQQWLARRTDNHPDYPKYLFPAGMRRGGGAFAAASRRCCGLPLVVTEDLLSQYRVARDADYPAMAALGTSLDRDTVVRIAKEYTSVILWLDPDYYGQLGQRTLARQFQQLDVPVRLVVSERDPKNHTPEEVAEYLRLVAESTT